MSDNPLVIVEKLFASDNTERGRRIKQELVEAYEKYMEDDTKRLNKLALSSAYFKVVSYILKKRIPEDGSYNLKLTPIELNVIDYGYMFPEFIDMPMEEVERELKKINWNTGSKDYLKFYSISGYINHEFHKMMGYFEIERLDNELEKVEEEYNDLVSEKRDILSSIIEKITDIYSTEQLLPYRDIILKMNTNLYRLTEAMLTMKKRVQEGEALSAEERTHLISIENNQKNLKRDRNLLYKENSLERKTIMTLTSLEDKYFKMIGEVQDKYHEVEDARKKREKFAGRKVRIPLSVKEEFISEKVEEIKELVDYASKRSKVVSFPFLTKKVLDNLPEKIQEIFLECERNDKKIFGNKEVRLHGMPKVLIGPGCGNSFFSYESGMFYVPIDFPNKLEDSIINGIVIYKWDMDETRELRDSFSELKKYKNKSFVELQKGLVKEYHTYITKECRGYKVMDKDIKEWFLWQIAPSKREKEEAENKKRDESLANVELKVETVDKIVDKEKVGSSLSENYGDVEEIFVSDRALNNFYRRINKILKWSDVRDRIVITPSENGGDIDIKLLGIDLDGVEIELLFNALLIQAKLRRYRGMEKENWNKKLKE